MLEAHDRWGLIVREWGAISVFLVVLGATPTRAQPDDQPQTGGEDERAGLEDDESGAKAEGGEGDVENEFQLMELEDLLAAPVVESGSRRAQSLDEAPASISLITQQDIAASGAPNVAELMRLVPGMFVLQGHTTEYTIGLRGLDPLMNNRVLVLVDGRQISDRHTGAMNLAEFAVNPGDLEKVEVIRGPGSTLYGANAMTGVINLTTKRPLDHPGFEASAQGEIGLLRQDDTEITPDFWLHGLSLGTGGRAHTAYNWINEAETFGVRLSAQLGRSAEWPDPITQSTRGLYFYSVALSGDYRPTEDLTLFLSLSHDSYKHIASADVGSVTFAERNASEAFNFQLEKKHLILEALSFKVGLDGKLDETDFNPPIDVGEIDIGDKIHGVYRSSELHAILLGTLSLLEGRNVLTVGGEATWFRILDFPVRSQSLLTGLMFNNETRLLADGSLIIDLGGRLEQIVDTPNAADLGEDLRVVYRHFNPRLAVIWRLGENHNLRIAGASAFRTPTPYDLFLRLGVQLSDPPIPPVAFITGNPRLRPEDLRSLEVGYRGILFDALRVDAVAFGQQIRDVIGDIPQNILPSVRQNLYGYDQVGLELGLKYYPTRTLSTSFNYSFLYSSDHSSGAQVKDYPVHLYGLGAELRLPWRSRITTDAYLVFDYQPSVSYFVGLDSFNPYIQWERVQAPDQIFLNVRYGRFFLDDRAEVYVMARNIVGFFRDPKGLKMWPVESAQPIGGLIMLGVSVQRL